MGSDRTITDTVLLFENYLEDSQRLHTAFKLAGIDYPAVVIEDDGYLPDDVQSVVGFFMGDFAHAPQIAGRPRYFNQIPVPEYWEITANHSSGKIYDLGHERGRIFYAKPLHKRLVKVVDWLDERGVVRFCDHYNKYGACYARTVLDKHGKKVNKTYFSPDGCEILMENYVTGDWILNDGGAVRIFHTLAAFVCFFLERAGLADKRLFFNTLSTPFFVSQQMSGVQRADVLFWQEPRRSDIPGNMQIILDGRATRAVKIMVQRRAAYEKLLELGAEETLLHPLGYVYPFVRENMHRPQALICTNSDQISKCRELAEALPQLQIHIAALTEMSAKLLAMEAYENVTLYPAVTPDTAEGLFASCDIYLDINHGGEILSAGQKAFLNNQLILGFQETVHNRDYAAPEHLFAESDAERLIACVRELLHDHRLLEEHLQMQRQTAMEEEPEAYRVL